MLSQEVSAPPKALPETLSGTQPEIASEILPENQPDTQPERLTYYQIHSEKVWRKVGISSDNSGGGEPAFLGAPL